MGMPLEEVFHGVFATRRSTTSGRDLHFGDLSHGVLQPISHVGDMVPVITGIAMAFRQRGEDRVALTWVGDGATKTSTFHEGVNLAGVLRAPAVFVIQNNQVALGTRLDQHGAGEFRDWPKMYGIRGAAAEGNNVLDVWAATRQAAEHARSGGGPTAAESVRAQRDALLPSPETAELEGFSAGVRQPGLAARLARD
jgi:TPP-dependent pyruvate/acetoin dehydrogenase alpha subunit